LNTVELKCGSYEVLRVLKQTRDKSISLARNVLTDEKVILRTQVQDSQAYMLLSLVRNEHLAKVLWVQNCGDTVYIVEEYIDGVLLSDVVRDKVLPRREVLRIGLQLCKALRVLHSAGIVYRDLKPENVFLMEDGSIKLFDYDAARVYKSYAGEDTTPLGTVGFAAPEQFGLMQSDARSDIYSLGILLNILLTGVHPALRLCRGRLRRVVLRCTNVNPERRYQTVEEVSRTLKTLYCGVDRIAAVSIAAALIAGLCLWRTQLPFAQESEPTVLPDTTPIGISARPASTLQSEAAEKASLRIPMSFSERIESV